MSIILTQVQFGWRNAGGMMRSWLRKALSGVRGLAVGSSILGLSVIVMLACYSSVSAEGVEKNLSCRFDTGTSTTYVAGAFKSKPAQALTFDIAGIDLEAQTARLTTGDGNGAGTLRVVRALNANHFIEVVNEGFLNLTTIYDLDPTTKSYPAVHSRHLGLLGQPLISEYTGHCKPVP